MSNEQTRAVLLRAAEILEPEGSWCQGHSAFNEFGRPTSWGDGYVKSRCLYAAISKAAHDLHGDYTETAEVMSTALGEVSLTEWNDAPERTQAEVVQALRDAAATVPS